MTKTKKELKKEVKSLEKLVMFLFVICIASLVMVTHLSMENMRIQQDAPLFPEPDNYVYAYSTPVDEYIDSWSTDSSCVLDVKDFTHFGGSVWVDIRPECVRFVSHTFTKE